MESQTFYFFHTGLVSGVGLEPSYYPASLLWSPGPRPSPVFRSAICDCLSLNVSISCRPRARVPLVVWAWDFLYAGLSPRSPAPCSPVFFALSIATVVNTRMFLSFSYFLLSLYSSVTAEGQPASRVIPTLTHHCHITSRLLARAAGLKPRHPVPRRRRCRSRRSRRPRSRAAMAHRARPAGSARPPPRWRS